MPIRDKIQEGIDYQNQSIPAKRLKEKLLPLKSKEEQTAKRWFWELLQNASDYNDTVSVKLDVDDHKVVFSHNGNPFSIEDVLNLISPDSRKDHDEVRKDNIGKFGSGLVSTHILSSEMSVQGAFADDDSLYKFELFLDRRSFENKDDLIKEIQKAKKRLLEEEHELISAEEYTGYMTSFAYNTNKRLLGMSTTRDVVSEGLQQIYDVLPYTLAFMTKVASVEIHDSRKNSTINNYRIYREQNNNGYIVYNIEQDDKIYSRTFIKQTHKRVETTFEIAKGRIQPYPTNIAKLFCGLPMIGSEKIGLPIIVNSFAFEPTIEREGVEITAGDDHNRGLLTEAGELYHSVIQYISANKLKNAYHLTKLSNTYNGLEGSKIMFKSRIVPLFQSEIENAVIVENVKGEWIKFSNILLAYKEGKPFDELYEVAREIKQTAFPTEESFKGWVDATDFTIFKDQKFALIQLAEHVAAYQQLQAIVLQFSTDTKKWLHKVISLIVEEDENLLSKHYLLPNQKGQLKSLKDIYIDDDIPEALKAIHNKLLPDAIEESLLDSRFNDFAEIIDKKYSTQDIAHIIDITLKEKYSAEKGSTASFIIPLNDLYKWINSFNEKQKDIAEMFPWFYPKRATLFMDTFGDEERDYAFSIVQSGKMKALASLADSSITAEELEYLSSRPEALAKIYALMQEEVDDKEHANSTTGDYGEELVYNDLKQKYPRNEGYEVVWSSKKGEPHFDFEVRHNSKTMMYVDAKTTTRGIANSDSIPFFMRMSQWEFLPTIGEDVRYVIARVFAKGDLIQYMQIKME